MDPFTPWFQRRFTFPVPDDCYPELLARLKSAPERLAAVCADTSREVLHRRLDGKWSAQENAGHLILVDELWLTRMNEFLAGAPELSPADLTNQATTDAGFNEQSLQQILAGFRESRAKITKRLEALGPVLPSRTLPHPRLKQPMRLLDHIYFIAEHDDQHFKVIESLKG